MRVSVIIPTRNEALALTDVLADLPAGLVSEVIVVDSNSTDGTPEIAARWAPASSPNRDAGMAGPAGLGSLPQISPISKYPGRRR